jgi:tetratricopeptide (TPR) repeat protein
MRAEARVGEGDAVDSRSAERFEPGEPLGVSALQRALLARDRQRDSVVVMKIARAELPVRAQRAFLWDTERMASLRHPHLVPILARGTSPVDGVELPWLVEPRAERTLAQLRAEPPPWETLKPWLLQTLAGLGHLHARGLLHGALKPEDLALFPGPSGTLEVRITDAGRSEQRREADPYQVDLYRAPELRGHQLSEAWLSGVGPWSDLWSLGMVLWELLTGELPAEPGMRKAFVPRVAVPARMEVLLSNLLEEDPLGRYDLAADVRTELEALGSTSGSGTTVAPGHAVRIDTTLDDVVLDIAPAGQSRGSADPSRPVARWNRPVPPLLPEQAPGEGLVEDVEGEWGAQRELPLLGRQGALEGLWGAARQVVSSRQPVVVVLLGEAGEGRTATVRTFARLLEEGGHAETSWIDHGAVPTEDDGVAGTVRGWVRPTPLDREAVTGRMESRLRREGADAGVARTDARSLVRWLGAGTGEPPGGAVHAPRELFRVLRTRAWRGLSCLVLDDAQWSSGDSDGLALVDGILQRQADGASELPLLVVVVLRPSDLAEGSPLRERVERWMAGGARKLELGPLQPEVMRELARGWGVPEAERAALVERAGGSPLRLQLLAEQPGGLDDMGALAERALSALGARAGHARRLSDVLLLSSLAGRAVPAALVRHFAGEEGQLDLFVPRCGWYEARGDRLVARSSSLHEALRSLVLARPDRAYLHRRLARAWGKIAADPLEGGAALEAARHGLEASDGAFAVPHALAAAERAWLSCRPQALELASRLAMEAVDDPRTFLGSFRAASALWRGRAHLLQRDFTTAQLRFDEARTAFEAMEERLLAAEAQLGAGWAELGRGELDAADRSFTASAQRAHQLSALGHEARAIAGKGWIEVYRRKWDDADVLFARSLARHSQLSDLHGAALAVLGQGYAARRAGRFDEADELYAEAVDHFREAGDPAREIEAQLGLAISRRQRVSDEVSEVLFDTGADRAAELGELRLLGAARMGLADLARDRGDRARAERIYRDCLPLGGELAVEAALGLAQSSLDAGDQASAYESTRLAAQGLEGMPGHPAWARYRIVVAALLALRRDHTQTWQWLWSAQEVGLAETTDRDHASCLIILSEVAAEAGWGNVLRLAGKLAAEQLERLQDEARATRLRHRVAEALM